MRYTVPPQNGVIHYEPKINFVFWEEFSVITDVWSQLFSIDLKSPRCLENKVIVKTNKTDSDFQLQTKTPRTPRKNTHSVLKIHGGTPQSRGSTAAAAEAVY